MVCWLPCAAVWSVFSLRRRCNLRCVGYLVPQCGRYLVYVVGVIYGVLATLCRSVVSI